MNNLQSLKLLSDESDNKFFSDEDLQVYLNICENNLYKTASMVCRLKASKLSSNIENESIKLGPIEVKSSTNTATYWLNLADSYDVYASQANTRKTIFMKRADQLA